MSPEKLANKIKDRIINKYDFIKDINVMGAGFINFYLKEEAFIKEHLKSIENGDFKKLKPKNKNVKVAIVLNKLRDILNLQSFRGFINMYYLAKIYDFAGYKTRKLVLVKDNDINLNIKYFLSNFKNIEIILDKEELRDSIIFCSTLDQGKLKGLDNKRFTIEEVNILKNGHKINKTTFSELLDIIGIDRIKYTLSSKAINKKITIELTNDDLRYIQYPYSRITSVINIFKDEGIDIDSIEDFNEKLLTDVLEKEMINKIMEFKDIITETIDKDQPYRFIKYSKELCDIFYKINASTLFRQLSNEKLIALLKLLNSVKIVLEEILNTLELPVYEKM
ncbi:Arginyl tRNA synthetase N terminal domain-containing protein [Paramaledivibacter caminithermalis DSM 15212]|uniref:arginine--tRNA ligase n=2 Tax=Paramaledivibacter TaxID=1884934 RepID=A0A1M6KGE7_PARC5|nr:Arginyl tRNA synthetase N terminal domain-containing protein [Paramaledivibacter caminithermalis DSM 15212]